MKCLSAIVSMLLAVAPLFAEPITFESNDTPATLIELFTSEGCSSCPPADEWVGKLKSNPDLWKHVVPVVFHVDYWNSLGWPDRFATAANTARQRRYASAWRSNSVYTPGFVLNGREWRGWSQREKFPEPSSSKVGKLAVTVSDGKAGVSFTPSRAALKPLQAELALLGADLQSDVKRGENRGRSLRHDFTVLHFNSMPLRADGNNFTATVPLPVKTSDEPVAIAVWVTPGEAQPQIQATGGWLRKP